MDCSLLGSSAHGIFQAIVLEWIAISFSRGSSRTRDRTWVSRIVFRRFTTWVTRELQNDEHKHIKKFSDKWKRILWQMDATHCSELSSSFFLHVSIGTNSSFIWATPLQDETTHVITHLLTYFAIMRTPNSIKTDNGPAYTSKQFR